MHSSIDINHENPNRGSQAGRAQRKAGAPATVEATSSPLAVFSIALLFLSSGFALVVGDLGSSAGQYVVQFLGPAGILLTKSILRRPTVRTEALRRCKIGMFVVALMSSFSAAAAVFDPILTDQAIFMSLLKTGGLILVFVALTNTAASFTEREILYGLLIFAVIEPIVVGVSHVAWHSIRENATGARIATSGLVLFALTAPRTAKWYYWVGSLVVSFLLQCRTSMVASVGAVIASYVEQRTRGRRGSLVAMAIVAFLVLAVLGDDIAAYMRQTALRNLGSSNPIAQFFLSDKDATDISGDFLDRRQVWTAMLRKAEDRPLIGYGIGAEHSLFRIRSHNAYLSLLIEGGVCLLLAWLYVYGIFVGQSSDPRWRSRFADTPIGRCQVVLFAYLVLAALVESSGIGSIATPNNVIFLFLTLWVSSRLRSYTLVDKNPRSKLAVPR